MGWPCYNKDGISYTRCGNCSEETNAHETRWFEDKLFCLPCHESTVNPLIEEFTKGYESGECDWNDEIKCPYCGHDNEPADAFDGGEPKEWQCKKCGLEFDVEVEYSYTFQTIRREGPER
ncbi:hypothetical protein EBB07_00910 [Paenibacillaceae bacterium]|nr:hypothetical protein EBB07_00910 [Paenibacillaceae bacterium]